MPIYSWHRCNYVHRCNCLSLLLAPLEAHTMEGLRYIIPLIVHFRFCCLQSTKYLCFQLFFFWPCIPTWRPNNQSLCADALNIGIWTTMPLHHLSLVNGGLHSRCGLDQWGRNQAKHTISNHQPAMKNIKLSLASSISKVRIHVPYRTIYKSVPCIPPETTLWSPGPQHREKVMSEKLSMCFWLVMRWDGIYSSLIF